MAIAEAGMYKTVMERQVLVVIYGHKEHPKNRALRSECDFSPQNVSKFGRVEAGRDFSGVLWKRPPLPSTLRRFASRRSKLTICRLPNHLAQATLPVGCGAVAPRSTRLANKLPTASDFTACLDVYDGT